MAGSDTSNMASALDPLPEAVVESHTSLNKAVWDRRADYTHAKTIKVKVGTWNVAANAGTEKDIGAWFVHGKGVSEAFSGLHVNDDDMEAIQDQERRRTPKESTLPKSDPGSLPKDKDIGLYVLGLQEIVDVSSPVEAMRPYHDRGPSERWKSALLYALPKGYKLIAEQQLVGMYILIYASSSIAPTITNVSCRSAGTGLLGYMGNKGAVAVRLVIGDTTRMVFVNSHLSAGAEKSNMDRRNWDASQVIEKVRFEAIEHGQGVKDEIEEAIGDEDFCFWFGDLNYRLADLPGDDIRRLLMLHTKKQYEKEAAKPEAKDPRQQSSEPVLAEELQDESGKTYELDPDQDPESMQATISSLLPHDELHDQMRKKIAFYEGWQEGKIRFMPTYKYDVGSVGMFDSSEKRRAPSWCDRILYRTRRHYQEYKDSLSDGELSKGARPAKDGEGTEALDYDYDTDEDAADPSTGDASTQDVTTKSGYLDKIQLEYYTSHQRVLSSDHKPLDAVFELTYQAVDPERKAAVYSEVAKDFDRQENESRPSLTLAIDGPDGRTSSDETIDYGKIYYDVPMQRTITIANTGRATTAFDFTFQWDWLTVTIENEGDVTSYKKPIEYHISPGDALTATITVHVKRPKHAEMLFMDPGSIALEDVLVFHVKGGHAKFLTMHASWMKTCWGLNMWQLVRLPESGARDTEPLHPRDEITCSTPRELLKLLTAMEDEIERAVAEWGMTGNTTAGKSAPWDTEGWPLKKSTWIWGEEQRQLSVHDVREQLDTGVALNAGKYLASAQKVEVYAEVFIGFVSSIYDGVVTERQWQELKPLFREWTSTTPSKRTPFKQIFETIFAIMQKSTPHNVSFVAVIESLKRIIAEITIPHAFTLMEVGQGVDAETKRLQEAVTRQKRVNIAERFGYDALYDVLFRPREDGSNDKEIDKNVKLRGLLVSLLLNEPIDFTAGWGKDDSTISHLSNPEHSSHVRAAAGKSSSNGAASEKVDTA